MIRPAHSRHIPKYGSDWTVKKDGFYAHSLKGNPSPVNIPKNRHLVIIMGEDHKPEPPDINVCFSVRDQRETELYFCFLGDFRKFCRRGLPPSAIMK